MIEHWGCSPSPSSSSKQHLASPFRLHRCQINGRSYQWWWVSDRKKENKRIKNNRQKSDRLQIIHVHFREVHTCLMMKVAFPLWSGRCAYSALSHVVRFQLWLFSLAGLIHFSHVESFSNPITNRFSEDKERKFQAI